MTLLDPSLGQSLPPLATATILLGLGIVAVAVARMLRVSPILGYLALGMVLNAAGFPLGGAVVGVLAEVGVALLLFETGLHFSIAHLRAHAGDIFGLGSLQTALAALALGSLAALVGMSPTAAVLIGTTLALSSTAVVARLIAERHQQGCPVGLTATSVLVFQDLVAIFLLIAGMALGGRGDLLLAIIGAVSKAILAFAAAAVLARYVARPLLALVARSRQEEVLTAAVLFLALSAGLTTEAVGLSFTLGAFLCGVILSDTPYRVVVEAEVRPFRGLLLGFFFLSVGLSLDLSVLAADWLPIIAIAAVILLVKSATNMAASLVFRWSIPGSVQLGILIAQGSEFAFVILGLSPVREVMGTRSASVLIAAVALTIALTPNLADFGRSLAGRMRAGRLGLAVREITFVGRTEPVIIAGMGQVGRRVADALTAFGIGYTAVERDPQRLREAVADGYQASLGDLSDPRIWVPVTHDGRKLAVLTAPDPDQSLLLDRAARDRFPEVRRFAVVRDTEAERRFREIGIETVLETDASPGWETAAAVLHVLGVGADDAHAWTARSKGLESGRAAEAFAA